MAARKSAKKAGSKKAKPKKPAAKPPAAKPAAKPAAAKPAAKPPAVKPSSKPPAVKPAAQLPAAKPAPKKPEPKPAPKARSRPVQKPRKAPTHAPPVDADFPDDDVLSDEPAELGVEANGSLDIVADAPVEAPPPPKQKPRRLRAVPPMPPRRADGTITVAYSPDADDAFMFYALLSGKVDTEGRRYELVQDDIQVLNEKAREGVYDVTAISFGAYPYLADRYLLLTCGASFGDQHGPVLVARTPIRTNEVNGLRVAVPGLLTTATLTLRLWLPHAKLDLVPVPFDQVLAAVRTGNARAGILIHEAQLAWRELNLVRIVDLAQWWGEKTEGLPLPLGANAIRRDIPEEERTKIALDVKRSIAYGLGHRDETLEYATKFAKGLSKELVDRYVAMYVGELALDFAERGRQAVTQFFDEAHRYGFLPEEVEPEFA